MRILALFALVFVVYSLARILNEWQYRSATHKTLWFVILAAISIWGSSHLEALDFRLTH